MEAEMMCLLMLHHPLYSNGSYHLVGPSVMSPVVSLAVKEHGGPRLHAMGAHPWTTEHR